MGQSFLADRHFIGQDQLFRKRAFTLIDLFTQPEQSLHFLAQSAVQFHQALVTDGVMLGRIGVNLAAVQTDVAQSEHVRLLRQKQDLHEQLLDLRQKRLAEVGQSVVVGVQTAGDKAERNALVRLPFDLARTEDACGIAIEKQAQQDFRRNGHPTYGAVVCI
jgi:hypothetical protein